MVNAELNRNRLSFLEFINSTSAFFANDETDQKKIVVRLAFWESPANIISMKESSLRTGKRCAMIGFWLFIAGYIFVGIAIGVGIPHVFATQNAAGISDATHLGNAIGQMLLGALFAELVLVAGLVFVFTALLKFQYRTRKFFYFNIVCGVLLLGTPLFVVGIFQLIYCIVKRREFFPSQPLAVR